MESLPGMRPGSVSSSVLPVQPVPPGPVGPRPFGPPRTIREVCGAHARASADPPDIARWPWGRGPRATGTAARRVRRRGRGLRAGRRCDRVRRRPLRRVPARPGGGRLRVRRDRRVDVGGAGRSREHRRGRGRGRPGRGQCRAGPRPGAPRALAPVRAPPLPLAQAHDEAHRAALSGAVVLGAASPLAVLLLAALLLALAPGGAAERDRVAGRGTGRIRAGRAGARR